MNKITLVGNITNDLEIRRTQSNKSVLDFSIAVNDGYGENKRTDFIKCVAWESRAENIQKYFNKGSKILVCGKLRIDEYMAEGQKRYKTYVLVDEFEFMQARNPEPKTEYVEPNETIDDMQFDDEPIDEPTYEQQSLPFY